MTTSSKVLLLVGSPKGAKSTSESLGIYLLNRLQERGWETEKVRIQPSLRSTEKREKLLSAVDRADLLALIFPLYVDSLPAAVIRAMELIAQRRQATASPRKQQLLAIVNCGFPEALHNDTALAICRRFAYETGVEWVGGLALGAGQGAVNGEPLDKLGGRVRNITQSLKLTAAALAAGNTVPQEAVELMAKPFIPTWLYRMIGGLGWRLQAREHGVGGKLHNRPYQQ